MVGHEGNKNGKDDYQPSDGAGIKWVQVSAEYQGDCRGDNRQNGENIEFHLVVGSVWLIGTVASYRCLDLKNKGCSILCCNRLARLIGFGYSRFVPVWRA